MTTTLPLNSSIAQDEIPDEALPIAARAARAAQLKQAQSLIQKYAPSNGTSVVDEFIAERRAEADRE